MNKIKIRIWDRDFELNVVYQNYPGEEVTENQRKTLDSVFLTDFGPGKAGVEAYIRKYFSSELGEDTLENIFRFVMPKSILIPRTDDKQTFAVLCNFKLDMEHGIAVLYEDNTYKTTGPQDLAL